MDAFFFGSAREPLFGIYEPPVDVDRRRAAVLCHPTGEEYFRLYRPVRALALRLSEAGVHVLRFDYVGTGNSGGDADEHDAEDWLRNVGQAADEVEDLTGLRTVTLVGLRGGAVLALRAARERSDVDGVVLWEPWLPGEGREHIHGTLDEWGAPVQGGSDLRSLIVAAEVPSSVSGSAEEMGHCTVRTTPEENAAGDGAEFGGGGLPNAAIRQIVGWTLEEA